MVQDDVGLVLAVWPPAPGSGCRSARRPFD